MHVTNANVKNSRCTILPLRYFKTPNLFPTLRQSPSTRRHSILVSKCLQIRQCNDLYLQVDS